MSDLHHTVIILQRQDDNAAKSDHGNGGGGGGVRCSGSERRERAATWPARAGGGTWRTAKVVPGTAALNTQASAGVGAVSCASAGNCSAAGYYDVNGFVGTQAWVADQTGGIWGNAENLPGTSPGSPSTGNGSSVSSLSCTSATRCVAGGTNPVGSTQQAIVASRT